MSVAEIIRELEALRALLAQVRASRQQAEANLFALRRGQGTPNWVRFDALTSEIATCREQERSLENRIAVLQQALNRARLFNFLPVGREVVEVPAAESELVGVFPTAVIPYTRPSVVAVQREPLHWGAAALVAAFVLGLAVMAAALWLRDRSVSTASAESSATLQTAAASSPVVPASTSQDCDLSSGPPFVIGGREFAGVHVGPCVSGRWVPAGSAVYADSKLQVFGVEVTGKDLPGADSNARFVGYTETEVILRADTGFFYVPGAARQVADQWRSDLQFMGHSVAPVRVLRQR